MKNSSKTPTFVDQNKIYHMKRTLLLIFTLLTVTLAAVAQPRISSNKETHNFGQIEWKKPVTVEYTITNTGNEPLVLTYSGFYNIGVKEIWDMVYEYIDFVKKNGYFDYRRNEQSKYWMYETINEQLRDSFYHNPRIEAMLQEKEQQVLQGNLTSFIAAKSLLDTYFDELKR